MLQALGECGGAASAAHGYGEGRNRSDIPAKCVAAATTAAVAGRLAAMYVVPAD
jgi:hypothetical protein